jgi:hypothetical protein
MTIECQHCGTRVGGDVWDNPGWFHASWQASLGRGKKNMAMMTESVIGYYCSTDCFGVAVETALLATANLVVTMNSGKPSKQVAANLAAAICPWCRMDDNCLTNELVKGQWLHAFDESEEDGIEKCLASFIHDIYPK